MIIDLQSFLQQYELDYPDRVWHIRDEVPRDYFTTAATPEIERMPEPPVFVFEQVQGIGMPVVTGLFSSRSRIAYTLGTTAENLHQHWVHVSKNLRPPVEVSSGICQEICHLQNWTAQRCTVPGDMVRRVRDLIASHSRETP